MSVFGRKIRWISRFLSSKPTEKTDQTKHLQSLGSKPIFSTQQKKPRDLQQWRWYLPQIPVKKTVTPKVENDHLVRWFFTNPIRKIWLSNWIMKPQGWKFIQIVELPPPIGTHGLHFWEVFIPFSTFNHRFRRWWIQTLNRGPLKEDARTKNHDVPHPITNNTLTQGSKMVDWIHRKWMEEHFLFERFWFTTKSRSQVAICSHCSIVDIPLFSPQNPAADAIKIP